MTRPTVNFLFNVGINDVVCSNPAGDSNFLLLQSTDRLVWRDSQQNDGDTSTGAAYPPVIPDSSEIEAPKTFLIDNSASQYVQIYLAGTTAGAQNGGNTRYVFAAYFTGATVTTPYLEAWDDSNHTSANHRCLGYGNPVNSLFRAIGTTDAAPGTATWMGTALAGLDSRVALAAGALATAQYVYWNMKHVIPYTAGSWNSADWFTANLVFSIHFTYN